MLSTQATPQQRIPGLAQDRPIVADATFVLATRDTGYRSAAAAVGELVDNALQAHAMNVHIFVIDERVAGGRHVTVGVLDDGIGMDPDTMQYALQFGGTNRFNDRSGFGRFGMGLPNSSVSQTKRFEVYSWSAATGCIATYLDVDEVTGGQLRAIPVPVPAQLPTWAAAAAAPTGTLVVWSRCDRLDYRKATTVACKLSQALGRIYRRALWKGVRVYMNGVQLVAADPLFCHPLTGEGGGHGFGDPLTYEIAAAGASGVTSTVMVRFTELPVALWYSLPVEQKRQMGIVGGAGVSILRAGREIDYGWHLMGAKRRENYDDWWRCEVSFEPALDELFGVTHSKQGITPTPELRAILGPDLEAIARELNARARTAFKTLRAEAPSRAAGHATERDPLLPPPPTAYLRRSPAADRYRYRIEVASHAGPEFFTVAVRSDEVRVRFNADHPFVKHVYEPARAESGGKTRYALESAILAAARARLNATSTADGALLDRFISDWGDALAAFVGA